MAIYGPLLDEAGAAIIVNDADLAFGCMGCARTDELLLFILRQSGIPILELDYPGNEEEGVQFVAAVRKFLDNLPGEVES
jgi:putative methanogenesis marker protein 5